MISWGDDPVEPIYHTDELGAWEVHGYHKSRTPTLEDYDYGRDVSAFGRLVQERNGSEIEAREAWLDCKEIPEDDLDY